MVQQAESLHSVYRAGLNEAGLIGYFNQPSNRREKFADPWSKTRPWWPAKVAPCEEFASWEQLVEDRNWALVASELIDAQRSSSPPPPGVLDQVLGDYSRAATSLPEGQELPRPGAP